MDLMDEDVEKILKNLWVSNNQSLFDQLDEERLEKWNKAMD